MAARSEHPPLGAGEARGAWGGGKAGGLQVVREVATYQETQRRLRIRQEADKVMMTGGSKRVLQEHNSYV